MIDTKVYYIPYGSSRETLIYQNSGAESERLLDYALNSGKLELSRSSRKKQYPRFHGIRIKYQDTDTLEMLTEDYVIMRDRVDRQTKGELDMWSHTIDIVDPRKLHERIWPGSKKFSRNRDGSPIYTLYDCLKIAIDNAEFYSEMEVIYGKKAAHIPDELKTILERVDAPALTFLGPTLAEMIDGILAVVDATYELDLNFNIIAKFFNKRTGEIIDISDFDGEQYIADGEYYGTKMDVVVKNLVNDKPRLPEGIPDFIQRNTVIDTAFKQNSQNPIDGEINTGIGSAISTYFRTEQNNIVIGDQNQIIQLKENLALFEIEKVYLAVAPQSILGDPAYENTPITADITDFVVTDAEYIKLRNAPKVLGVHQIDENPDRQCVVKYEILGNKITGFGDEWGVFGLQRSIDNLIYSVCHRDATDPRGNFGGLDGVIASKYGELIGGYNNNGMLFTVIYRPIVKHMRVTASRTIVNDINIPLAIRDHQDENTVSAQNFVGNLQSKINRLANIEWNAPQTVTKLSQIHKRGQVTPEGYVITAIHKVMYPEFLKVKYGFVENFQRLNQFIRIDAIRRKFQQVPTEIVDRDLNYTNYLHVLPGNHEFSNGSIFSDYMLERTIKSLLSVDGANRLRGALIESDEFDIDVNELNHSDLGTKVGIYLPVHASGAGDSLLFTFGFEDNLSAGNRVAEDDNAEVLRAVRYVDQEGFLKKARIKLINYLNPEWFITVDGAEKVDFKNFRDTSKNLPAVVMETTNLGNDLVEFANEEFRFDKDIGDKINITLQLQHMGYEKTIILGENWVEINNINTDLPGPAYYLYVADEYYDIAEKKKVIPTATRVGPIGDYATYSNYQIILNANGITQTTTRGSWAIADFDGNLVIAVNQFSSDISVLSFLGSRRQRGTLDNELLEYANIENNAPYYETQVAIVTFDTDGGNEVFSDIYTNLGETITYPGEPTKDGFIFSGWDVEFPYTVTQLETTITAQWIEITNISQANVTSNAPYYVAQTEPTYDITFELNGGTLTYDPTLYQDLSAGDVVNSPGTPTKEGYNFTGWLNITFPHTVVGDRVIEATYEIKTYSVSFDMNGGSPQEPTQIIDHGSLANEPPPPTRTGYIFDGWNFDFTTPITSDTVVTAQWVIEPYAISTAVLDSNAPYYAAPYVPSIYNINVTTSLPGIIFFDYFSENLSENTARVVDDPVTEDTRVTIVATEEYIEPLTETVYRFERWNRNGVSYSTSRYVSYKVSEASNFEAIYSETPVFDVTFDLNGGSLNYNPADYENIEEGTVINSPGTPTRTGYNFTGWSVVFPYEVNSDIIIDAFWSRITYDIDATTNISPLARFDYVSENYNTNVASISDTVDYGSGISLSAPTQVTDSSTGRYYNFVRWERNGSSYSTNPNISISSVTSDMSFVAIYEEPAVAWTSGGTEPIGGTTCNNTGDIGNTVCTENTTCEFIVLNSYLSSTDDTSSPLPNCGQGVTRTVCVFDPGLKTYVCEEQEGEETTTYTDCQKCELV